MRYCETVTKNHSQSITYPDILTEIFILLQNEGCKLNPSPFAANTSLTINGDKLEEFVTLASGKTVGDKKKSVDLIFGVKSQDNLTEEFQFVELKLRTQGDFYYLDKFSLRDKINSSALALGNSKPISKKYYLVFRKEILNLAERYLFRINPKLNNDFKAIDVVTLHQLFF
jgi:hypothetical protein